MNVQTITADVTVYNVPTEIEIGYMVARQHEATLWYYGTYETRQRAAEVAKELKNGVVVEVKR